MKKIILFLLSIGSWAWVNAQGFDSLCTSHFEDIHQTGTALHLASDEAKHISLPFDFELTGISSHDLVVTNNGGVLFHATDDSRPVYCTASEPYLADFSMGFYPLWANVGDSTGNVFWEIKGTAPNRYLVVEWYRRPVPSFFREATFELILHEGTNEVEFHYGDLEPVSNFGYDENYTYFIGIKGEDVLFRPFYYNYYELPAHSCLHWAMPERYPPVFHPEVIDSCEAATGWIRIIVKDLGGAPMAVFSNSDVNALDTVRSVPDTLLWGPFPDGDVEYPFDMFNSIRVTVPDSTLLSTMTYIHFNCPPPHDDCPKALPLPVNDTMECNDMIESHNFMATPSGINPGLPGTPDDDVWFTFHTPYDTLSIKMEWLYPLLWFSDIDKSMQVVMALYEGPCNHLQLIKTSEHYDLYVEGLDTSQTYYLQVYSYHDLGPMDDVSFDLCARPVFRPVNDNCDSIVPLSHYYDGWNGSLHAAEHDFDTGCLQGSGYRDIIFKADVPAHEGISLMEENEEYMTLSSSKIVALSTGSSCPGDTLLFCGPLTGSDEWGPGHTTEWANTSDQTKTVYIVVADTMDEGSDLYLRTYIGCPFGLEWLSDPDQTDLDNGTIRMDWIYWPVDVGTVIRWKEAHDTVWQYDSLPPRTNSYTITHLAGGNYQVDIYSSCGDASDSHLYCVSYHDSFEEDFEIFPRCWKHGNGADFDHFWNGTAPWDFGPFAPDSTYGNGLYLNWMDNDEYWDYTDRWLVTPKIFLNGNNTSLSFDMAVTMGATADWAAIPAGDTLMLKITADEGRTWTELARWDHDHSPANLTHFNVNLGNYAGHAVRIAWVAKYGYRSGSPAAGRPATGFVRTYLDNVQVGEALASGQTAVQRLRLYPNPVHDMLHWQSVRPVRHAQIWSLSGRLLRQWQPGSTAYTDVSSLPAGVYVLRLQTGDGQVWIHFFIKE